MTFPRTLLFCLLAAVMTSCGGENTGSGEESSTALNSAGVNMTDSDITVTAEDLDGNPFMVAWETPFGVPPFDAITDDHYLPAFYAGVLAWRAEIDEIATSPEPPTFENTILALEASGALITKVRRVFGPLAATDLTGKKREVQSIINPMYTRESDRVYLNEQLWNRVSSIFQRRSELALGEQEARLLALWHRQFVRAGAALDAETKSQVAEINEELASLTTQFGQQLLSSTKDFKLRVTEESELTGLSDTFKASLWDDGVQAWVLTLDRSVFENFMTQSENRALRGKLFDGYRLRASAGDNDNGPLAIEIAQLRARRAGLLGYESHAAYVLEYNMARTPDAVEEFLLKVWKPGLARASEERADMQAMIGDEFTLAGQDWWHYSEKVRLELYDLDAKEIKPYFELSSAMAGAFELASRLFGLTFVEIEVPLWNGLVKSYEVRDENNEHLGVFMFDMYARDSKRGGAWMTSFRSASAIGGETVRPIVSNNLNLTIPPEGQPTLLTFSEVETLFHEFGHGLHGLMTTIAYPTFSGVDGPRDYTEFPAQILEHWASQSVMLELYAQHYETGAVIPESLVARLLKAANHNQGFRTSEYIAAALLDLRWHMLTEEEAANISDARAFEKQVLDDYGLLEEIEPRYRSNYFSHIFVGGYSSGYYSYLWSEILDADGFNAFLEAGDIFDPETAGRLRKWVYEAGGLLEADELYQKFRGSDPSIEPLLRGRGFDVISES